MNLIQYCIRYPVTTAVGVLLLLLFGSIALFQLPIQLLPNINQPVITVNTIWPGASPNEIEREIVAEQEEELKTIEGLVSMESESHDSLGIVILRFQLGTNKDSAMIKVANRLAHRSMILEWFDKHLKGLPDGWELRWKKSTAKEKAQ